MPNATTQRPQIESPPPNGAARGGLALTLSYWAAYVACLCARREGEIGHWLGLVALPLGMLALWQRRAHRHFDWPALLASVGFHQNRWRAGLAGGLAAGLLITPVQFLSRNAAELHRLLVSPRGLALAAAGFVLMLCTAAATEEVFFRGILQTRLRQILRTNWLAVPTAAVLFSLYHWPYAYFQPQWPSHGRLTESLAASFATGLPLGLLLGAVYARARENLFAPILAHALINTLPAMIWLDARLR